uniref:Complex 1 LYR protein domain-containing protein n=1 Tax=Picea sitchensis TaxID=3332 RepID=A9NK74_PICSI|nr:unknown [Picea sitchensis]ABR17841.1 unknown [Picea sitchensis]
MERSLRAYGGILRLIRLLPKQTRSYYQKYARENFVNYREVSGSDSMEELLQRTYNHACWVLKKYQVDEAAAKNLKEICFNT